MRLNFDSIEQRVIQEMKRDVQLAKKLVERTGGVGPATMLLEMVGQQDEGESLLERALDS